MAKVNPDLETPTTSRIEAFSDGVFAIVLTLLVLELRVPQITQPASWQELAAAVAGLAPKFLSFLLSFVYVAIFWISHHQLFHYITRSTPALLWLNTLFLLFLTFIPFPTALLGEYADNNFAVVFFGSVMVAASASFTLLRWFASVKAKLLDDAVDERLTRGSIRRSLIGPALYLTATLLGIFSTQLAIVLYLLIPLFFIVPLALRAKAQTADGETQEEIRERIRPNSTTNYIPTCPKV